MDKLIITCAVTGSAPTKNHNPNVPYTPQEIAEECLRAWRAGAAIAHIHVRDPQTGKPDFKREYFEPIVERVRAESDLIVNLTTSGFNIKGPDVEEQRLMPLDLQPDICSLDVGSMNFRGGRVFQNPEDWVEKAAQRMMAAGVKPEMEVFELGHIRQSVSLVERGLIADPPWYQVCLGVPWGAPADVETLLAMKSRLPKGCMWSVLAAGAAQLPITTHALLMGGHVRVGFEDGVFLRKGVLAKSNAELVERTTGIARVLQREVATCAEAREMLGIAPR